MPNVGDPTLDSLQRKRKMAEALMQESMTYQPMTHPLQALAKVFQAYVGQKQLGEADTAMKGYEEGQSKKLADALMGFTDKMQGAPEIPMPDATLGGGPGRPAIAPDQKGAFMSLVQSGLPQLQQAGLQGMLQRPKEDEPFTLKPGETRFGPGAKPLASLPPEAPKEAKRKPGELRSITKGGMEEQQEWDGEKWTKVGGGPRWQPPQGDGSPKAPAGYRWSDDGKRLEAIPGGPATPKPAEQYLKQQTGVENVRGAITEYRDALKKMTAADFVKPDARAKMGTIYNNMLLQAKEAYNLGVLNGPDYMILQKVVTDPMSLRGAFARGSLDDQAAKLDELMKKIGERSASVHQQAAPGGFKYLGSE